MWFRCEHSDCRNYRFNNVTFIAGRTNKQIMSCVYLRSPTSCLTISWHWFDNFWYATLIDLALLSPVGGIRALAPGPQSGGELKMTVKNFFGQGIAPVGRIWQKDGPFCTI